VSAFFNASMRQGDDGPPGALLGAVRAVRRALHADPDDPLTHLLLGEAYLGLLLQTRERVAAPLSTLLDQLRTVQAITALKTAARLQPKLVRPHNALAALYNRLGYLDLELEHLEKWRDRVRAAGPQPGESADEFGRRLRSLEEAAEQLGKVVRERRNRYDTRALNLEVYPRADAAITAGLAKKALDILTHASYEDFGVEGAQLELELLLATGRCKEVREGMKPEFEDKLKRHVYRRLRILVAAATGDYVQADGDLALLAAPPTFDPREFGRKGVSMRAGVALLVGRFILVTTADARLAALQLPHMTRLGVFVAAVREQAELLAVRGLLALEQGAVGEARRQFGAALEVWREEAGGALGLARHYLELMGASGR
jgi:tetratricopeptide (TPR) repeat protein